MSINMLYKFLQTHRFNKKQKDISDFERVIKKLRKGDDTESTTLIEKYNNSKKGIVTELTAIANTYTSQESQKMVKKLQEDLVKVL